MVLYLVIDQFFFSKKAYFLSNDFVWFNFCFLLVRIDIGERISTRDPHSPPRAPWAVNTFRESEILSGPHRLSRETLVWGQSHLGEALHTRHCTLGRNHPPPQGGGHAGRLCWNPHSNSLTGPGRTADTLVCRLRALSQLLLLWPKQPQAKEWPWPCATETLGALTFEFQTFLVYRKIVLFLFYFLFFF